MKLTVSTSERAVEYVDGIATRVLDPGRHRVPRRAVHLHVPTRTRADTTAPQDVLTADGVSVRITAVVVWRITDPRAWLETVTEPFSLVYLAVQLALRDVLVGVDLDVLVRDTRRLPGDALIEAASTAGRRVGVTIEAVEVKDVGLPHELRAAYADLASARTRGQAQLEAARAETAALRSLANGAKLLDDHPALARLRLVQALPPGATVELGV